MSLGTSDATTIQCSRDRLAETLFASLAEIPAWQSFLTAFSEATRCDHASLIIGRTRDGQLISVAADHGSCLAFEASLSQIFSDNFPFDRVSAVMLSDAQAVMVLPVAADEGPSTTLVASRNAGCRTFDRRDHELMALLAAPLKLGMKIFHRVAQVERRQLAFGSALETSDIGVVVLDPDATIFFTNSIADELLAVGDGLQRHGERLCAANAAETARLMGHVREQAAAQSASHDWNVYVPLAISRLDQALPLTVLVRPGPAFGPLKAPLRRSAMLIMRDPARRHIVPPGTLARLFGLTRAEALLAGELASGISLDDAAKMIGVSRNTVRSQLQAIFAKTGTNRQGDLVRVLLSSAAMSS